MKIPYNVVQSQRLPYQAPSINRENRIGQAHGAGYEEAIWGSLGALGSSLLGSYGDDIVDGVRKHAPSVARGLWNRIF